MSRFYDTWRAGVELVPGDPTSPYFSVREPYEASVPLSITDLDVHLSARVWSEAADASAEFARLDGELLHRFGTPNILGRALVRLEAAASSAIEGIHASAISIARASLNERGDSDALLIIANERATTQAVERYEIATDGFIDDQVALLAATRPDLAGSFRDRPVWIGGISPATAVFVPPVATRIEPLLDDLVTFCARTDIPGLVHAAIAHAQFETIHPFGDGNGRTGRALSLAVLHESGLLRHHVVPLSAGLVYDRGAYYSALTSYREGDLEPIVARFTVAALRAAYLARGHANALVETHEAWQGRLKARRDAVAWRVLATLLAHPCVNMPFIARTHSISEPAAQRALEQLAAAGILRPLDEKSRARTWVADDIIEATDNAMASSWRRF